MGYSILSTAKKTALITFAGGTAIIVFTCLTNSAGFAIIGLLYALIMTVVNIVILAILLFKSPKGTPKVAGLMLLNIPVCALYLWLGIKIANTVRITLVNATQQKITSLKINGCEEKLIPELASGQSKTMWVSIPNDCEVSIVYLVNGQIKNEDVTGYVTNEGGFSMTFRIGTNQKPYDQDL